MNAIAERLPPANVEAEMGVLGSVLLDNATLHDVIPILRPEDFYRDEHQKLYRVIRDLADLGKAVDVILLHEELARLDLIDDVGGNDTLVRVIESVPHAAHARYYADIVRQKAISRSLIEAANSVLDDNYSNHFDAETLLERSEARMFAAGGDHRVADAVPVPAAIDDSLGRLRERDDGVVRGLDTGLAEYDDLVGGLHPGQLVILAARPSIGKTALALNIAEHLTLVGGHPALFVSLEMTRGELGDRLLCGQARVEGHKFMQVGRLTDDDRARIAEAAERLKGAPLFIDDAPTRTISEISSLARRYRARRDIGALFVDYLQLVEVDQGGGRGVSRQEQIALMSRRFKVLAKDLDIPVVVLSQLNRNAEGREDKRPHMADIRESGAVEQDANVILLLHRPEYYDPNELPGQAELIVAKNRGGQTGTVRLKFEKGITRFSTHHDINPAIF